MRLGRPPRLFVSTKHGSCRHCACRQNNVPVARQLSDSSRTASRQLLLARGWPPNSSCQHCPCRQSTAGTASKLAPVNKTILMRLGQRICMRSQAGQTRQDRPTPDRLQTGCVIEIVSEIVDKFASRNAPTCSSLLSGFLRSVNV